MRLFAIFAVLWTSPVFAAGFDRPVPQAQSATAEIWFAIASVVLIAALWLVHYLVMRND